MAAETGPPSATDLKERSEEHSSSVLSKAVLLSIVVLALIIILTVYDYLNTPWSGWIGLANKKSWDYLELLIVPAVLAFGAYGLNQAQRNRELEIEKQRAQDATLQTYLDQMTQLLLHEQLRESREDAEVRTLARARTKEVLWKLSEHRKRNLLQFLHEASLIESGNRIIDLSGADLRDAYLRDLDLRKVDLRGADIKGADLSGANLSEADLQGAMNWSKGQLLQARSLEGACMPNSQDYKDWIKDEEVAREHG